MVERQNATAKADRLYVNGYIIKEQRSAEITPLFVLPSIEDVIPRIPGEYSIVLRDSQDKLLARYNFTPSDSHVMDGLTTLYFTELVPFEAGMDRVEIEGPGGVLKSIHPGSSTPTVELLSPNGGETVVGDSVTVSWKANDQDGDTMFNNLQYSPDNGTSWLIVDQNINAASVKVDLIPGSFSL